MRNETKIMNGRRVIKMSVKEITEDNLQEVLRKSLDIHNLNSGDIDYLYKYYKGDQPIRYRIKEVRPEICNRIVENRANEIDNNLVTSDFNNVTHNNTKEGYDPLKSDNVDYIADRLLEKITLFKEQQNKKIEKKVDEVVEKEEDKIDNSIEGKDYTFIGDSVMKMGEPYIKEIFKDASIDAKVSRQFTDLPKVLESLKANKKLKNIVVIHLGTNGVINKESFESSMKLLEGKTVYLMNTVVPKPWEKSVNESLEEWSEGYDNITIIDWYKYAKGEKKLFYKDATHPKPEGAKKYAEFILETIKSKK